MVAESQKEKAQLDQASLMSGDPWPPCQTIQLGVGKPLFTNIVS